MTWTNVIDIALANPPSQREMRQLFDYLARHAKARFYTDENFPSKAVALLKTMGAKVTTAKSVGLNGHPDENQIAFALKKGLVFLTCDRDFLDEKRFPLIHCPAVFVFDFGSGSISEMRQAFRCLASVFRTPQFYDKWWKVDAKRDSWREYVRFQDGSISRGRYRIHRGVLQEWVASGKG
jgi:predicted nuclease of predicted toxin-antitoxin system